MRVSHALITHLPCDLWQLAGKPDKIWSSAAELLLRCRWDNRKVSWIIFVPLSPTTGEYQAKSMTLESERELCERTN